MTEKRRRPELTFSDLAIRFAKAKTEEDKTAAKRDLDAYNLRKQIRECRECPLAYTRKKSVPWQGKVDGTAKMVIADEAPGWEEDGSGTPLIGESGRLLNTLLKLAGGSRAEVAVVNTLCCRPPLRTPPEPDQIEACRPNLRAQLELIGGWIGVALGGHAMANVLGVGRNSVSVEEQREQMVWKNGRVWICTFHPYRALKDPQIEKLIAQDLELPFALYHSNVTTPSIDYPEVKVLGRSHAELGQVIQKQGWALVDARRIGVGTQILVVDERVNGKAIPRELAGLTRYSIDELLRLGLAGSEDGGTGKGGYRYTRKQLAQMHMVKTEFGAEIVE